MITPRLIPLLLIHSGGLQKSQRFASWKYVGDVLNAIKIFNEKDVDELVLFDVDATREGRGPNLPVLQQIAGECFMPLAYGGGISSVDSARRVMDCGIEKVVLNSAAWKRPGLVSEVAAVLGSSSTVVSCDLMRRRKSLLRFDYIKGSAVKTSLVDSLREVVAAGAGEVILQSRDHDGTLAGPDLAAVREIAPKLSVPVVYGGGIRSLDDCVDVWRAGASGVAAGAWFVFRGPHRAVLITYPNYGSIKQSYLDVLEHR